MRSRLDRAGEGVLLAMACLAPWAFGSVDAWAEFVLELGVALVGILALLARSGGSPMRRLICLPSLALGGLVLLAVFQTIPLPWGLLDWLDPATASLRGKLLPAEPERVLGDVSPPVPLPPPALSLEPGATLQTAARLAAAWLLLQGVLGLGSGFAGLRRLGVALAGNATLLALVGMVQALTWNGNLLWIRPLPRTVGWTSGGPFACHSHFAEYLNMGLGFALGSLLAHRRGGLLRGRGGHLWAAYAAGVLVVGIVTSHSRGGVLAMTAALLVLLVGFLLRSGRLANSIRLATALTLIVAMAALLLLAVGNVLPYQERLASILEPEGYAIRFWIWGTALRAWCDHPLWGTGLGSFAAATAPFFDRDPGVFFARAENEYVDLLTEGGLVGLGLGLALLLAIGRLAIRALAAAPSARDRGAVVGGIFGLLTLAFHSLSDFGPHVPGVGVPALILAGHLVRLGLAAPEPRNLPAAEPTSHRQRVLAALVLSGPALLGVALAMWGFGLLRVESLIFQAGLPLPGTYQPSPEFAELPAENLQIMRTALAHGLQIRPDWTEGHLRLGQTYLGLYNRTAEGLIGSSVKNPATMELLADPLWLLGVVHGDGDGDGKEEGGQPGPGGSAAGLLDHEPIHRYLVPAARCFLEARRCCPVSAHAHVELASLDYLLCNAEPSAIHLRRALRTAGADRPLLAFAAQVAVQTHDLDLAAQSWRRCLEASEEDWAEVADASAAVLPPEQILAQVVSSGRCALRFAERLYSDPAASATRDSFLQTALERLSEDRALPAAERLSLEAQAYARLNMKDRARERMLAALVLEPGQVEWRSALIDWLLAWGKPAEAHDLAMVGIHYQPNDSRAQRALERTDEALARGDAPAAATPHNPREPNTACRLLR